MCHQVPENITNEIARFDGEKGARKEGEWDNARKSSLRGWVSE